MNKEIKEIYNGIKKAIANQLSLDEIAKIVINSEPIKELFAEEGLIPIKDDYEFINMIKTHIESLTSVANMSVVFTQQNEHLEGVNSYLNVENLKKRMDMMLNYSRTINKGYDLSYMFHCEFGEYDEYFDTADVDGIYKYIKECIKNDEWNGSVSLEWRSDGDSGDDSWFDVEDGNVFTDITFHK